MLPQVLNFAAANQNQMINHKLAFELSVTQNYTGDGKAQMQECLKTLISFCVLRDDVVLFDFPGDLFYYSYPPSSPRSSPDCGQISRHKAALLPI